LPESLSGGSVSHIGPNVVLAWAATADPALEYYEVRLADSNWGVEDADLLSRGTAIPAVFPWPGGSTRAFNYYVKVRNIHGGYSTTALNISGSNAAPSAPTNVTVEVRHEKLFIEWTAPGGSSDIVAYTILMDAANPPTEVRAQVAISTGTPVPPTSVLINIPPTGDQYVIVFALDAAGAGASSSVSGAHVSAKVGATSPSELNQWLLPFAHDAALLPGDAGSANKHNAIHWGAFTLTFADGTTQALDAGDETGLTASTIYFLYLVESNSTVQITTDETAILAVDRRLLATIHVPDAAPHEVGFIDAMALGGLVTVDTLGANTILASHIHAQVLTGATIQTAASGQRAVIQHSDNTMRFYDSGGANVLIIDDDIAAVTGAAGIAVTSSGSREAYLDWYGILIFADDPNVPSSGTPGPYAHIAIFYTDVAERTVIGCWTGIGAGPIPGGDFFTVAGPSGDTFIKGDVDINGAGDIAGALNLQSTLDVSGALDAASTGNFAGLLTAEGSLEVDVNANIDGTLDVGDAAQFDANLNVDGTGSFTFELHIPALLVHPSDLTAGEIWIDTSESPKALHIYDGTGIRRIASSPH
jgi:hypothetical protein